MLTLVIQAGGESRRMGFDKAFIPFLGQPLVQRVIGRISHLADEILITTNKPENFSFQGVQLVPDIQPGRGALGGLYTALQAASHAIVGLIACDMPFVNPDLLQAEYNLLEQSEVDVVVPLLAGGYEPFHAIYRRVTCLALVKAAIKAERWRVDSWFKQARLYPMSEAEVERYDPQLHSFININTPQDLQSAIQIAIQRGELIP